MCSIFGALLKDNLTGYHRNRRPLTDLVRNAFDRGRDGVGVVMQTNNQRTHTFKHNDKETIGPYMPEIDSFFNPGKVDNLKVMIGNTRAEPTTEYVLEKHIDDQQPYSLNGWHIVHNGTIANDKELRKPHQDWAASVTTSIDSAAIVEVLAAMGTPTTLDEMFSKFYDTIRALKGSYAILAYHTGFPDYILTACNYRPIWVMECEAGYFFASQENMLPYGYKHRAIKMIEPYTVHAYGKSGSGDFICMRGKDLINTPMGGPDMEWEGRALVVCSGGLDSVVAATKMVREGANVTLIHFLYGSRAEGPEVEAVKRVAQALNVPLVFFPIPIYDPADSPLLQSDATVAGGEEGAEYAHEWVPARNLVMLSVATAYAEAKGFAYIVLGNNLEEAGAYPDNEPEFINRFNALLPFAVGDGKWVRVLQPVGNLMKHEIVALGLRLSAPLEHTWSCYRAGELHCGTCGPCFMRKTAFTINQAQEVITYENEVKE
ncbi:glutamine amidotransferase class-II [Pantoea phage vB_PagS_Vid5]|uniref:7-cyano-7-deazaguanine synthase n=1 Tax=Pantoea phage vB_PagS_Vid5 TaxID=2099652 RepID=A0A2P1CKL5_9CAUD|nr:L-glutamine-D-fructose-6-phosphate aminotransferase [Pantoea phage vB_PagS_Vid5]AVJ51793.1 glutamine amidotransferase class-II [Pantoea phage vB_PagS_Vid5]